MLLNKAIRRQFPIRNLHYGSSLEKWGFGNDSVQDADAEVRQLASLRKRLSDK